MSAPETNFDQLLSDHLDGRLDGTDAQTLQSAMRENPALQSQFDAMRADREALRTLFASQQSTGPRLGNDFAARVLAESRRRGLPAVNGATVKEPTTAPEMRSVSRREQPLDAPRRRLSWVMGLVATAAAVLLIASLTFRERQLGNDVSAIAQHEPSTQFQPPTQLSPDRLTDVEQPLPAVEVASAPIESLADPVPAPNEVASPQPSPMAVASTPTPAKRLDRAATVSAATVSAANEAPAFSESPFAGGMIVYDVRLSPQGRQTNVLSEAMRQVGLQDAPRLPVNREVMAAAKQAETFDEDAKFQVIYLQASAKRVDRLFVNLLREPRLVEGVRLSLITDAPILEKANQLTRVDATKVRHEGQFSFELENNANNELAVLRELLGEQIFDALPSVAARGPIPQPESLSNTGDDVISHVLILVR